MKREQIIDMIGQAPDKYVAKAQTKIKPHFTRRPHSIVQTDK